MKSNMAFVQVCSELKLFEAVVMWANHLHCSAEQSEVVLFQLLPLIRFPLMAPEELEVDSSLLQHHRCDEPESTLLHASLAYW